MPDFFQYHAFGLNICSQLELPELEVHYFKQEDVRIVFGSNPNRLSQIIAEGVLYQANRNQFLLSIEGISSFLVKQGTIITIDKEENTAMSDIRLFLLGPVIGAILLQRKMLPLHGSSVEKNGSSTIICGRSGAGKSTLAALLIKRGFSLLADDISLVKNMDNISRVIPGITQIKLWQDVVQILYSDYSHFTRVREQLLRYLVPAEKPSNNSDNQLDQIIIMEKKNSFGFEWTEVSGMDKFSLLKDHTYREQYIAGLETAADHFYEVKTLVNNVKVFILRRPDSPLLLNELTDFVEKKLIGT